MWEWWCGSGGVGVVVMWEWWCGSGSDVGVLVVVWEW